jgi:hypothetical protein
VNNLLPYVWEHRLCGPGPFQTTDGKSLEIIEPGARNSTGAAFCDARIRVDNTLWAGHVVIHPAAGRASAFSLSKAEDDAPVILHVLETPDSPVDTSPSSVVAPQWVMPVPENLREKYHGLIGCRAPVPCLGRLREIPAIYLTEWKDALAAERLEQKTQALLVLLDRYCLNWHAVFYLTLARYFGFSQNNEAFARLAESVPLSYLLRHSDCQAQIEAVFMGQAGLLELDSPPVDDYHRLLQDEYGFLAHRYGLRPLDPELFRNLRMWPNNLPYIKIVQLAGFVARVQDIFSGIFDSETLAEYQALFSASVSPYWETHYRFGKTSSSAKKRLGLSAINTLLINVVAPMLFANGLQNELPSVMQKAFDLLEAIPPERNYVVNPFVRAGVEAKHAGDSQALIQLRKSYCDWGRCLQCRIGHRLLG